MLRTLIFRGLICSYRNSLGIHSECISRLPATSYSPVELVRRWFSSQPNPEEKMRSILGTAFPKAKSIEVIDVSGGCGAMYEIYVEAPQFKGLSIVKQHRLVTDALKEEIKDMHGLRIQTSPT